MRHFLCLDKGISDEGYVTAGRGAFRADGFAVQKSQAVGARIDKVVVDPVCIAQFGVGFTDNPNAMNETKREVCLNKRLCQPKVRLPGKRNHQQS